MMRNILRNIFHNYAVNFFHLKTKAKAVRKTFFAKIVSFFSSYNYEKFRSLTTTNEVNKRKDDEQKIGTVIEQGFYILTPSRDRNMERVDGFQSYICENKLHEFMLNAKRNGLFVRLPNAVGLKRFSISHGLQWK